MAGSEKLSRRKKDLHHIIAKAKQIEMQNKKIQDLERANSKLEEMNKSY